MTSINIATATTVQLVEFFNANTGGNPVKKFADRKTAERRVGELVAEMAAEEAADSPAVDARVAHPLNIEAAYREIAARESEGEDMSSATVDPVTSAIVMSKPVVKPMANIGSAVMGDVHNYSCPHCGVDLDNGIGVHLQEVNGKLVKHDNFEYECLGCGGEFGHKISAKNASVSTGKNRPEMAKSLKLDRAIQEVTTGHIYANACQVWKAGLVSSSQCDRLSAVLYGAAKAGNRLMSVSVNGHVFALVNKIDRRDSPRSEA